MGGLSSLTDWVGDTIDSAFGAVGDAFEWVGDKVSEVWESDLGKIAMIAGAVYLGGVALTGEWGWLSSAVESEAVLSQGIGDIAVPAPGVTVGSIEGAGMGLVEATPIAEAGALEAAEAASFLEPVSTAVPELSVSGADLGISGVGGGDTGVLTGFEKWAADNPMMAYGGMMMGGQAVSGYMQGEQVKEMEEQRLKEEQEARDRQNVWGVNYAEGGEAISAGDRLKDLNRSYFDSAAPINPAVQDFQLASERQRAGVLNEVTGIANPDQFSHRARTT